MIYVVHMQIYKANYNNNKKGMPIPINMCNSLPCLIKDPKSM